jgi:hypothetical protein
MPVSKRDTELRLPKVSYLEFKSLEMDRVLTALFARLAHKGFPSRLTRRKELRVEHFVDEFIEHPEWFSGFQVHRDVVERWVETHLLDLVNRGKDGQAVAAPRPLHGFTYRFRNPRHARDYGAAQHLYEMLFSARQGAGQKALEHLERFFFSGYDKNTGQVDASAVLDVETQALLRLLTQVNDAPDTSSSRDSVPPLCIGAADLLAEDIQRLLFYERFIPRSVMVDYLKTLLAFHLALYHLRLFKLLPALVKRKGAEPLCAPALCPMTPRNRQAPHGDCPYRVGLLVDVQARPDSPMASLAARAADAHYRRIPSFVKASYATRKLDEFALDLVRRGKLTRPAGGAFAVGEVLALADAGFDDEREKFFGARLYNLIQTSGGKGETDLDPELGAVAEMGLSDFDTYIEMLVALRGGYHRKYITQCLDTLLLKNRPGAVVAQGRVKQAPRRFVLHSHLLEVLLQIAVLQPGGALGYRTGEMRVDVLLTFLRERYGLYIDQLPDGDGFERAGEATGIAARQALRSNLSAFISRLREIGCYRDLSDAYVTQTVTPRYRIGEDDRAGAASEASSATGEESR